jgi:hypothetical protein
MLGKPHQEVPAHCAKVNSARSLEPLTSSAVMTPVIGTFDVFHIDSFGQPIWQEAALTLDDALARVQQLGASVSGEYLIQSQKTGVQVSLKIARSVSWRRWFSECSESLSVSYRQTRYKA